MKNKVIGWIFGTVLKKASPHIVSAIAQFLKAAIDDLKKKAEATPNPYDNMAVELLEAILKATANK